MSGIERLSAPWGAITTMFLFEENAPRRCALGQIAVAAAYSAATPMSRVTVSEFYGDGNDNVASEWHTEKVMYKLFGPGFFFQPATQA